jgi:hypothetical protein
MPIRSQPLPGVPLSHHTQTSLIPTETKKERFQYFPSVSMGYVGVAQLEQIGYKSRMDSFVASAASIT